MCVEDYAALSIDWVRSATPPDAYWQLVGELGAIVADAPAGVVGKGARACQAQALLSPNELAQMTLQGIRFACQAYRRDGGTAIALARH